MQSGVIVIDEYCNTCVVYFNYFVQLFQLLWKSQKKHIDPLSLSDTLNIENTITTKHWFLCMDTHRRDGCLWYPDNRKLLFEITLFLLHTNGGHIYNYYYYMLFVVAFEERPVNNNKIMSPEVVSSD